MINHKLTPRGGESKPLKDRLVLTLFLKMIVTGTYIRFDFSGRHRCGILRITDQRCEINDVESVTEPCMISCTTTADKFQVCLSRTCTFRLIIIIIQRLQTADVK